MEIISRRPTGHEDYLRMRDLLMKSWQLDNYDRIWGIDRLDWVTYHYYANKKLQGLKWQDMTCLWENEDGQLVSFVVFEGKNFYALQVNPEFKDMVDCREMITWAENKCLSLNEKSPIYVEISEYDPEYIYMFTELGYQREDDYVICFEEIDLNQDFDIIEIPEGYKIRNVVSEDDYPGKNRAHSKAFNIVGNYPDDNYKLLAQAPGYRQELDLIAEYEGEIVAVCGGWYDEFNEIGHIEPLAVDPDYHKKGLGKAIIFEAFRRLRDLGAKTVGMHTDEKARKFYESVGYKPLSKRYSYIKYL